MRNYVTTYDPFFDLFFQDTKKNKFGYLMDTDIVDTKDHYEMIINVPSIKKEDMKISLRNGYLTISISLSEKTKEEKEGIKYILKERRFGSYQRSYFIGEDIQMKDISAKLEEGVLKINIQKPNQEELNKTRYVEIQ